MMTISIILYFLTAATSTNILFGGSALAYIAFVIFGIFSYIIPVPYIPSAHLNIVLSVITIIAIFASGTGYWYIIIHVLNILWNINLINFMHKVNRR